MERKTMGGFIATLRKANGMTQKDLAEKLNVSDKSVSRWERDDGAPDLSLIPVIAEIFGVTCDELLRGERKPAADRETVVVQEETTPKGEKQRNRILTMSLSKYKNRSFIAIGIAVVGLIATMIGNLGFLRANIGFLVGAIFYLASVICQVIFVNNAFGAVADDEFQGADIGKYKRSVVSLAEVAIGVAVALFAFSLPLVTFSIDTYMGLTAQTWFEYGIVYALIASLLYVLICYFLNDSLWKKGMYSLGDKEEVRYRFNRGLLRNCSGCLIGLWIVTYIIQFIGTSGMNAYNMAEGTTFHDIESFVAYMEQDIPRTYYYDSSLFATTVEVAEPSEVTYYDEQGNVISEEEALTRTLTDANGNVVCEYIERNEMVSSVRYTMLDGGVGPIQVLTYDDIRAAEIRLDGINLLFAVVYVIEIVTVVMVYCRKRMK